MSTDRDVAELRKLFPVVAHWTYLYNGSIHPCPLPVSQAMQRFLKVWEEGGESAYFTGMEAFERVKERFAKLIHAEARSVVVLESTTAGMNLAAHILRPTREQNVVVNDLDFMSDTWPWLASEVAGCQVRFVASKAGKILIEDLERAVDSQTAAVSVCAVTVGSGYRFDLGRLKAVCARHATPLIVDSSQALGVKDIDARACGIDFLANTASKWLMGPTGVGFLYLSDRFLKAVPPTVGWLSASNLADWDVRRCELYGDARRFQGGIPNLIGVVGADAALGFLAEVGREFIERRVEELTTYAWESLAGLGVEPWTPGDRAERAGIVFFRAPEVAELHRKLKAARIYCGHFQGGIRIDPTFYNTVEEIDRFLAVVRAHVG